VLKPRESILWAVQKARKTECKKLVRVIKVKKRHKFHRADLARTWGRDTDQERKRRPHSGKKKETEKCRKKAIRRLVSNTWGRGGRQATQRKGVSIVMDSLRHVKSAIGGDSTKW